MFDSYVLRYLLYTAPFLAVGIVGLVFGFRVRSRNNSAGLLTIVGWGMVLCGLIIYSLSELYVFGSFGLSTDDPDHEMKMALYGAFAWIDSLLIDPVALGCILLGILRLASSEITTTGSRASSVRYQPLDLHATGDR